MKDNYKRLQEEKKTLGDILTGVVGFAILVIIFL
jgi:hypothetical protein